MHTTAPYAQLARVYDEVVAGVPYSEWARFCHDAWAGDRAVHRVLDVCCGSGRMSAELIALGHDVTGVDGSAAMIARARELLGPDAALSVQVLPRLVVDGPFDAAVSSFDSLNYLPPTELVESLTVVGRALRPRGWFVFDVHTEAMMRTIAADPVSDADSDGVRFAMVSEVDVVARTAHTRVDVTDGSGATFTEEHRQHFFTDDELRGALDTAGLDVVAVTDDYTNAPVDASTLRATWVVRRAER